MHELACPSCSTASQFDFSDYLLMCPYCSTSFHVNLETGVKEIYGDHYIVPNGVDQVAVKDMVVEWLKRMHHDPKKVDGEYFVTEVSGFSAPYWVVSLEAHTVWKGLVRKQVRPHVLDRHTGSEFLLEKGQFRRDYRWAVSGRNNICETWGLARLHEPREAIVTEWDGFPLDSTFSRGHMQEKAEKNTYDAREFFDFKYSNGLPILGVQVHEEEAMRRAQSHVRTFHYKLASLNADYLVDHRTELEIAGIQLLHVPMWHIQYIYRPRNALKYFYRHTEKNLIIDGHACAVLRSELPLVKEDKLKVNATICAIAAALAFFLGLVWSPIFYGVALFTAAVSLFSMYLSSVRETEQALVEAAAVMSAPSNSAKMRDVSGKELDRLRRPA